MRTAEGWLLRSKSADSVVISFFFFLKIFNIMFQMYVFAYTMRIVFLLHIKNAVKLNKILTKYVWNVTMFLEQITQKVSLYKSMILQIICLHKEH